MITCNLMGGLGNQLFQIFTTMSYGIKYGIPYIFFNIDKIGGNGSTERCTYWDSLLDNIPITDFNNLSKYNFQLYKERNFNYNDFSFKNIKNTDIMLFGYFQSYYYFQQYKHTIISTLKFKDKIDILLKNNSLSISHFDNTISMHFRRGDYKTLQDYHPLLKFDYYSNSINYIISRTKKSSFKVLYFCEENDHDNVLEIINKLENKFKSVIFEKISYNYSDWEQLLLMSLCSHNIIANSSYSWWGAFLNQNKDAYICYPSCWFGPKISHNTNDLFISTWKKINTIFKYEICTPFILFHQPKTAGTYVMSCLPNGYVLPHNKNYHFCLSNDYDFKTAIKLAIIRNPVDYYVSLISFWCLDPKYCKDLELPIQMLNVKYKIEKYKSTSQHLKYWISEGYTQRDICSIINNLLCNDFQEAHSDYLIANHHTYDYYIFNLLNKLNIGYYTLAFLDQYSSKKISEFDTEDDCNDEIIKIKNTFTILNQSTITNELQALCHTHNVPFKSEERKMESTRISLEEFNKNSNLIDLIQQKDRLMFKHFNFLS